MHYTNQGKLLSICPLVSKINKRKRTIQDKHTLKNKKTLPANEVSVEQFKG